MNPRALASPLKRLFYSSLSSDKNLIYAGPVNQMVKRMKNFSIGSSLASTAFAPALIYFSADHWSLFAKFGLVSTGNRCIFSGNFIKYLLVLLTSYGTSYLFHLLIKKYVFTIYKGIPSDSFDHLLIEKLSFWGRRKVDSVPLNDLVNGESIFNTWKSVKSGQGYLIQFIDDQTNNHQNVTSYKGEKVDLESMARIYNEISKRR